MQLAETGEEINHAHVDLNQPDGKIRTDACRCSRQGSPRAARGDPAIERVGGAAGTDYQIHREHAIDMIETKQSARDAIHIRDGGQIRQHRHESAREPQHQHREYDQRSDVHRPERSRGIDKPEVTPVIVAVAGLRQRLLCGCRRDPTVLAEKSLQAESPNQVRIEQHGAGEDADQRERGGISRREPEAIPAVGRRPKQLPQVVANEVHFGSCLMNVPKRRVRYKRGSSSFMPLSTSAGAGMACSTRSRVTRTPCNSLRKWSAYEPTFAFSAAERGCCSQGTRGSGGPSAGNELTNSLSMKCRW